MEEENYFFICLLSLIFIFSVDTKSFEFFTMDSMTWDFICDNTNGQSLSQRVPNVGLCMDPLIDDNSYYLPATLYPNSVGSNPWHSIKEESPVVR